MLKPICKLDGDGGTAIGSLIAQKGPVPSGAGLYFSPQDHISPYSKDYIGEFSRVIWLSPGGLIFFLLIQSCSLNSLDSAYNKEAYSYFLPRKNDRVRVFFGRVSRER